MPEQHVLDRLASIPFGPHVRRGKHERLTYWASDVNPIIESLTKDLSDHRRIALAYEAQVEQQAQQIGALRAEQARLRAALTQLTMTVQQLIDEGVIVDLDEDDDEPSLLADAKTALG